MPKLNKAKIPYSLTKPHWAGSDIVKGIYNNLNVIHLQGWWRLDTDISSAGNVTDSSNKGHTGTFDAAGDRPAYSTTLYPSADIQQSSYTFDSGDDAINIGTASTWNAIIGNDTSGGSTQKMSFSFWAYKTAAGSGSDRAIQFGTNGVAVHVTASERVYIWSKWNGSIVYWNTADNAFPLNAWTHIAITYDANSDANDAIIYINGDVVWSEETGTTPTGTWDGISANDCYIGNIAAGNRGWSGNLADMAVWNNILTQDNVLALYNAAKGSYGFVSGYLNNPTRTLLQDQDNYPGSYPTVARTGDPNFLGTGNVFFDDTKSVEFFSSFAKGKLRFTGIPYDSEAISLTGSDGSVDVENIFEFQKGVLQRYAGSILIDIKGNQTTRSVAYEVAKSINSASMGLSAVPFKNTVKLRHHYPMTGTFIPPDSGNLIQTSSLFSGFRPLPVEITQFVQSGPENYVYPQILPIGSQHVNNRVASPNTSGTLTAPAIMTPGRSDVGINFTPGENIGPFVESRVYIDNDDDFYTIGTDPKVLPGFDQRLSSKLSITVDITPSENTDIYFSTGTSASYANSALGLAAGINSGLAYFNFANKRWEIIGDLTTGSNVDYLNGDTRIATSSYLAVIPPKSQFVYPKPRDNGDMLATVNGIKKSGWFPGLPCQFAGYPNRTRFNATGSQLLDMSHYLTTPFLCEKIVLEVSAAFGVPPTCRPHYGSSTIHWDTGATPITFMLLNQFDTALTGTFQVENTSVAMTREPDTLLVSSSIFETTKIKDIIWYGRYASYINEAQTGSSVTALTPAVAWQYYPDGWDNIVSFQNDAPGIFQGSDVWKDVALNVYDVNADPTAQQWDLDPLMAFYTGSVMISAPPRIVPKAPNASGPSRHRSFLSGASGDENTRYDGQLTRMRLFGTEGGRNQHSLSSGRSFIKSVIGSKKIGSFDFGIDIWPADPGNPPDDSSANSETYLVSRYEFKNEDSPYLLLPTDKLILAVANQIYPLPTPSTHGQDLYSRDHWKEGSSYSYAVSSYFQSYPAVTPPNRNPGSSLLSLTFTAGSTAKITFFGTQVRENLPVESETNQPLTSDAIHEDVRDDISPYGEARCLDQWQVEPISSYRHGYLDNIITGSMFGGNQRSRKVVTSVVDGHAGTTGSLQRFVRIVEKDRTFYDSHVPSPLKFYSFIENGMPFRYGDTSAVLLFSDSYIGDEYKENTIVDFFKAFPFEPKFSSFKRQKNMNFLDRKVFASSKDPDVIQNVPLTVFLITGSAEMFSGSNRPPSNVNGAFVTSKLYPGETGGPNVTSNHLLAAGLEAFFGVGQRLSPVRWLSPSISIPNIRGYKYGLINFLPISPNAIFRYDTFGQFRDMLESRPYARSFREGDLEESPINISFRSRAGAVGVDPLATNSQNLSVFATSSVPYFDGLSKDRTTVQPDLLDTPSDSITLSFD